jgi:hypothetical protein
MSEKSYQCSDRRGGIREKTRRPWVSVSAKAEVNADGVKRKRGGVEKKERFSKE